MSTVTFSNGDEERTVNVRASLSGAVIPGGLTPDDFVAGYEARHGGSVVDVIPDVSGNGLDLEQPVAAKRAVYLPTGLNGLPAYGFGAPRVYRRQWPTEQEPFTAFIVANNTGPLGVGGSSYCLMSGWGSATKHMIGVDRGRRWVMEQAGVGQHIYSTAAPVLNQVYVLQVEFNGIDRLVANGLALIAGNAGGNPTGGITLGARENEERHWPGKIAACWLARALTTAQKDAVRDELMSVYTP